MRRLRHVLASRMSGYLKKTFPVFATSRWTTVGPCRAFQMERLLPALSIGMGLDIGFFNEYHKNGENQSRPLHYPEGPAEVFESGEKGRVGVYTDFGTCTFLSQDDVGGLEVESLNQPGVLIPAPPIRGAAVFNIGDFLKRWSDDELSATLLCSAITDNLARHPQDDIAPRSSTSEEGRRRRSNIRTVFSSLLHTTIIVDCVPGCWGPDSDKPKKYPPINAAEYIDMRTNVTY
ncbi:hypothetical protein V5O48_018095 [Marasmius crinis-equi]|uniref:Isopenicillin N synthase-like Fe(2+) 2OG dioxygenase domain-containing protein n=1 Tax=Marasmius crinis-equi TaxID=585013 RepID=A0ABR3EM47_9AGAR